MIFILGQIDHYCIKLFNKKYNKALTKIKKTESFHRFSLK
jgi:hypothetical protein